MDKKRWNSEPSARLVPDSEKVCVGRDLADAPAKVEKWIAPHHPKLVP